MKFRFNPIYIALLTALSTGAYAEETQDSVIKTLGTITVTIVADTDTDYI